MAASNRRGSVSEDKRVGPAMQKQPTEAKRRSIVGAPESTQTRPHRLSFSGGSNTGSVIMQHGTGGARRHSAGTIKRRMTTRKTTEHIPVSEEMC